MNDTLVIYHSADLDGLCSREVARAALRDTADYRGFDYGEPVPDLTPYQTVYLIDISLPIEVMRANAAKMIVIDHHRTLIAAVQDIALAGGFKGYYCIDGVAACRLAYQYFAATDEQRATGDLPTKQQYIDRTVNEPEAVRLLGEYDIWDKRDPDVDLFQLGMQAEKEPLWDVLLCGSAHYDIEAIIERGRAIQAYTEVTNAQIITQRSFTVQWEGLTFLAFNTARSNSLTFTAGLKPEHDACLSYFWNGRKWKFSLYHAPGKESHDLSKIAVRYGGGGHCGAAGFELERLPQQLGGLGAG